MEPALTVPAELITPRLRLRRPLASDAAAIFAYASDPEVVRYMDWPRALTPADSIQANERALAAWDAGTEYTWRLTVPPDDTPIGAIACRIRERSADFGYVLNRRHWGRGYATEAAVALVEWLKSLAAIEHIVATCDVDNQASARVLAKAGLAEEARLPEHHVRPNMPGTPKRDAFRYAWHRAV